MRSAVDEYDAGDHRIWESEALHYSYQQLEQWTKAIPDRIHVRRVRR